MAASVARRMHHAHARVAEIEHVVIFELDDVVSRLVIILFNNHRFPGFGGRCVLLPYVDGRSTSRLIEEVANRVAT